MAGESELFPAERASEYLGGIPVDTLRWWRFKRRGPRWVTIGRRVMYRKTDLDAFIKQGEVNIQEAAYAS